MIVIDFVALASNREVTLGRKLTGSKALQKLGDQMKPLQREVNRDLDIMDALFMVAVGVFLAYKFDTTAVFIPQVKKWWPWYPPRVSFFDGFIVGVAGFIVATYGLEVLYGMYGFSKKTHDRSDEE